MQHLQSESVTKVITALHKAQQTVAPCKQSGKGHEGRKYSTLQDCWDVAKPVLADNELTLVFSPDGSEKGQAISRTWDKAKREMRYDLVETVCPAVRCTIYHSSGEWISSRLVISVIDFDPQKMGGAISYARRYLMSSMLNLMVEDDDAKHASGDRAHGAQPKYQEPAKPVGPTVEEIEDRIDQCKTKTDLKELWARFINPYGEGPDGKRLQAEALKRLAELEANEKADAQKA